MQNLRLRLCRFTRRVDTYVTGFRSPAILSCNNSVVQVVTDLVAKNELDSSEFALRLLYTQLLREVLAIAVIPALNLTSRLAPAGLEYDAKSRTVHLDRDAQQTC